MITITDLARKKIKEVISGSKINSPAVRILFAGYG
jgi:hypothetical protein